MSADKTGKIAGLLLALLAGGIGTFLCLSSLSNRPVALRFLSYTNNGFARIALFEITNQSAHAFTWTLYADGRPRNYRVAVTELVETNGELRHIGSGGPLNLFGHDSLQFGTDELSRDEKKVWLSIEPYPTTGWNRQRERLSHWLDRLGWQRGAYEVGPGRRVDGPVLP